MPLRRFVMAGPDPALPCTFRDPRVNPGDDERAIALLDILLVAA
jgi:hypothetical protein